MRDYMYLGWKYYVIFKKIILLHSRNREEDYYFRVANLDEGLILL